METVSRSLLQVSFDVYKSLLTYLAFHMSDAREGQGMAVKLCDLVDRYLLSVVGLF